MITTIFSSLKHPTRRRIIEELNRSGAPLSFSELMTAVGLEDTGTFGFHLRALGSMLEQDENSLYALSQQGKLAGQLVILARSTGKSASVEEGERPPREAILEVTVEGDESREPVGLGVRSHLRDKDHRRKVLGFMVGKLKEMEQEELDLVVEIQVYSSPDGKSTRISQNWKIGAGEDRRKWTKLVLSKLEADLGKR